MDDIKVFARAYQSRDEARRAYETAVQDYIGQGIEVGFTLGLVPGIGWVVVAVGRDASPRHAHRRRGGRAARRSPQTAHRQVRPGPSFPARPLDRPQKLPGRPGDRRPERALGVRLPRRPPWR